MAKNTTENQFSEAQKEFSKGEIEPADILDGRPFYVGIAASAGGLEAVSLLAQNLPKKANSIYIIAQHMSPTHKSLLTTLISRETQLDVEELSSPMTPTPDTIYVTPPNKDVLVEGGMLVLKDPIGHPATPKPSADRLFDSLAKDQAEKSVAIILSGTGSDGSYGVQSIREAGGITIAQDSKSAKYDGMPSAAQETRSIDLILSPVQIGQHLGKILATPRNLESLRNLNDTPSRNSDLVQILRSTTGVDFGDYKENTVSRRVARRMVALGVDEFDNYVKFCRENISEVKALFHDLLISVTRFFRDPKQFEQLAEMIQTMTAQRGNGPFRVWVAGCATGEEAYSIVILFAEALGGMEALSKARLQIFASDIDDRALDVARRGIYPIAAVNDIPKRLFQKYFEVHGNSIHVKAPIRNVVLFSTHNMTEDAPFNNVDLVSLRNVLIYFNSDLQERVLGRVHYALNTAGLLFLGNSETIGNMQNSFEVLDGRDKIFTKRIMRQPQFKEVGQVSSHLTPRNLPTKKTSQQKAVDDDLKLFDSLARGVAPDGFISTKTNQIVRVFGEISDIVRVSENSGLQLSTRILRQGLNDEASSMVSITLKQKETRVGRWHKLSETAVERVRLRAFPIVSTTGGEDHVLFALERRSEDKFAQPAKTMRDGEEQKYIQQMEADMESAREVLQQTIEELQTSNEEMQSVNEEMQSTNEELEATNEELETSNEELQSTNEELITVNEEMQVNATELQKVTSELSSILEHSGYPLLIVDTALIIQRLSKKARTFFDIQNIPSAGLHLAQINAPKNFPSLLTLCSEALHLREPYISEVTAMGKAYTLNIMPFQDFQNTTLGLQIALTPATKKT